MRRYVSLLLTCLCTLLAGAAAHGAGLAEISREALRTHQQGSRLVNFWWLPPEYWTASASELGKGDAELQLIRQLFRAYTLVGALDVEIKPDGSFDALSTAEIARRLEVRVNGAAFEPLREVDPRLQQLAPELSYAFQTSLGRLGTALHLLPLPNLDGDGQPLLTGSKPGAIAVRYRVSAGGEPVEFRWHAPFTAISGPQRCPEDGEPLEAHWKYCPWHGREVK